MRRYQAVPKWQLDRAIRRAVLRERFLVFVGGVVVALAFFGVMLAIGLLA